MFRGILGALDFNATNVLVENDSNKLISIDENHINGKEKCKIIGRTNMRYYKKHLGELDSIIVSMEENKEEKKTRIKAILSQHGYDKEFDTVCLNYDNLRDKMYAELSLA